MIMPMSDMVEKIFKAIPEASYDLIARILPGGIFVAAAMSKDISIIGFEINKDTANIPHLELVVIFLTFSYAFGLAISTVVNVIHWITWFFIYLILRGHEITTTLPASIRRANPSYDVPNLCWYNPFSAQTVLGYAHDLIKHKSPKEERPVVIKLFSEVALLYSLSISFLVALLIIGQCSGKYWMLPAFFLLAGMIRSVRVWCRHDSILCAIA